MVSTDGHAQKSGFAFLRIASVWSSSVTDSLQNLSTQDSGLCKTRFSMPPNRSRVRSTNDDERRRHTKRIRRLLIIHHDRGSNSSCVGKRTTLFLTLLCLYHNAFPFSSIAMSTSARRRLLRDFKRYVKVL